MHGAPNMAKISSIIHKIQPDRFTVRSVRHLFSPAWFISFQTAQSHMRAARRWPIGEK